MVKAVEGNTIRKKVAVITRKTCTTLRTESSLGEGEVGLSINFTSSFDQKLKINGRKLADVCVVFSEVNLMCYLSPVPWDRYGFHHPTRKYCVTRLRAKHTKMLLRQGAANSISTMKSQQVCQFREHVYRRNLVKIV